MLEINPVVHLINNVDLEEKLCKALSLAGTKIKNYFFLTLAFLYVYMHLFIQFLLFTSYLKARSYSFSTCAKFSEKLTFLTP